MSITERLAAWLEARFGGEVVAPPRPRPEPLYTAQPRIGPKTDEWLRKNVKGYAALRDSTVAVQEKNAQQLGH